MMVPVEWPIAAAGDGAGPLPTRVAGRGRLAVARADFFLEPSARLTEQERALMTGMLADLVNSVADEFRARLSGCEPANDDGDQLVDRLRSAGLLDIPDLIRVLLRRAEEERLTVAIRAGRTSTRLRFLQSLVSDEDPDVAAAAMGLILARGRRRDRFDGPRLVFDDLSAEAASDLVHAMAAGLRTDLLDRLPADEADERLTAASQAVFGRHDEGKRLEARLFELVHAFDSAGRLGDGLVRSALDEGEVSLVCEVLARRAGIGFVDAWDHFTGSSAELALLLRMSGTSREVAGEVTARLAQAGRSDPEADLASFDALGDDHVGRARKWLRLDPLYRSAIQSLAPGNGQRTF